MGGTETDPGVFINWTLRLGTTASRCITFNKFWPISRDLVFDIRILELWVANEVFMKKRNVQKRDFYSTVVMWNRIGKQKAKGDRRRTDHQDCYHNGLVTLTNNHCSLEEVHETEERHFEPSDTSLAGTSNVDDELLIAIKTRLVGAPPIPATLGLKPAAGLRKINQEPVNKQHFLANQSDKPKKFPTQVDDNTIIELKNQSTSTSHVKVTSRFTQSGTGLATHTEDIRAQSSNGRIQQDLYQRPLLQQNTHLNRPPAEILQSDQYQRPLQPRRNSFPNHTKQILQSPAPACPHNNYVDPRPVDAIGNSLQSDRDSMSLPGVPDYTGALPQRRSVSRSIRSSTDEAQYNQIHELSWIHRRNMGATLPYQQQLLRAAQDLHGDPGEHNGPKQPSQSRSILREASRDSNRERPQTGNNPYQDRPSPYRSTRGGEPYREPSLQKYNPSPREHSYRDQSQNQYHPPPGPPDRSTRHTDFNQGPSQYEYHPSPSRSLHEGNPYIGIPPYQDQPRERSYKDHSPPRMRLEPDYADPKETMPPPPKPSPGDQTVLAMTTLDSSQLCKCGSKELNLVCSCKKFILNEAEVTKTDQCFREYIRPRNCDDDDNESKKKKKAKRGKTDKEAKAEERRRKKEEKERERREKKERKAREKEARKSKCKGDKKSKNKKGRKMCTCCKCCGDEGETIMLPSEASQLEVTNKKKSKKEKKSKEKKQKEKKSKEKNKKRSNEQSGEPFRSCECPLPIRTEDIFQPQVQVQQQSRNEPSVLGYCNHPDIPCPGLSQGRVQSRKAVVVQPSSVNYCRDPACTNTKRQDNRRESYCNEPRVFRSCSCPRNSEGSPVSVYSYAAMVEQPGAGYPVSTDIRGDNPSAQLRTTQTSPRASNDASGAPRYRDITAAPAVIYPHEIGHGDTTHLGRSPTDPHTFSPPGFCVNENLLIDLSQRGRENNTNKRYVPPCVLYLDCTKVKDLCVIIKDNYEEDPS